MHWVDWLFLNSEFLINLHQESRIFKESIYALNGKKHIQCMDWVFLNASFSFNWNSQSIPWKSFNGWIDYFRLFLGLGWSERVNIIETFIPIKGYIDCFSLSWIFDQSTPRIKNSERVNLFIEWKNTFNAWIEYFCILILAYTKTVNLSLDWEKKF